jgi:hypothetical protein
MSAARSKSLQNFRAGKKTIVIPAKAGIHFDFSPNSINQSGFSFDHFRC